MPGITVHGNPKEYIESNYWLTTVLIDPSVTGFDYEQLRMHLAAHQVESRPLWKPMHMQPIYQNAPSYVDGTSERLFAQGLCLPSGPYVTDEDVAWILSLIKMLYKQS